MISSARFAGGRTVLHRATLGVAALTLALALGVGWPSTADIAAARAGRPASWAHRPAHHAGARPRVAISLSVTPSTGLTGPTIVVGTATGLTPGSYYGFGQCSENGQVCDGSPLAAADASGTVVIRGLARSVLDLWYWPGPPPVVDCRAEACQMILVDSGFQTVAAVPVTFGPGASGEPSRAAIKPSDHLTDGQTVTLTVPVGNFFPNSPVGIGQCIDDAELVFLCQEGGGQFGQVTSSPIDGTITLGWTVRALLIGVPEEPTIDCTTGSCALWLTSPAFGPIESFRLSFGGPAESTTTTPPGSSTVPGQATVPIPTVFTTTTSSTTTIPAQPETTIANPPSTTDGGTDGGGGDGAPATTTASGTDSGPAFGAVAGSSGSAPAAVAVSGPVHFTG